MHIHGCEVRTLDHALCREWFSFVLDHGEAPDALGECAWVLCHCDDGVTWGRWEDGRWRNGSMFFPDLCPVPSQDNLQEMRIFSRLAEVLIWRAESGFCGRVLRDLDQQDADEVPDRPHDELRLLVTGQDINVRDGFTRVRDGNGAEQVLPITMDDRSVRWPRLRVRHYFARDRRTGAVRVAASRFVEVI